jgi:cbb3-type cytochrome oxidase maturation protein
MEVIYILLPVALIIVIIIIAIFYWAVKSDQFEDLEGPAHRIIMDDDDISPKQKPAAANDIADASKDNSESNNTSGSDNAR